MNLKLGVAALVVGSAFLIAVPGCAADTSDEAGEEGDAEETAASQDELTSSAAKLAGAYHGTGIGGRPPTFEGIVFQQNGDFFADVDTGIRCITTPCPSNVRLTGRFTATRNFVRLAPKAGEQAHALHGRYRYTFSKSGNLSLTRSGQAWKSWNNELSKELSYCAEPTDCSGQDLIHPMCVGQWSCGAQRSCAWQCGVFPPPTSTIWPADRTTLVANSPGGGFTPPAPPGSTCTIGRQRFTLDIATRELSWEQCDWQPNNQPLHLSTGSRVITTAELATVDVAMNDVKLATEEICGADKPLLSIDVTSASQGTKTYTDSFYSCMGDGRTYVDDIDGVFGALRELAHD